MSKVSSLEKSNQIRKSLPADTGSLLFLIRIFKIHFLSLFERKRKGERDGETIEIANLRKKTDNQIYTLSLGHEL